MTPLPNKNILLYQGRGVSEFARRVLPDSLVSALKELEIPAKVVPVDSSDLHRGDVFENAAVILMPGGRDVPYSEDLFGQANAHIKGFVNAGGGYLGFCAGAYYACREIEFDVGTELEVCGARELGFYPGLAKGPAYGTGTYYYDSDRGAVASQINWVDGHSADYTVYYNGGCYFVPATGAEDRFKILANYSSLENTPAAIVQCTFGKGTVVLSGVHPEYPADKLPCDPAAPNNLYAELTTNEESRKILFKKIIKPFFSKCDARN